MRELSLFTGAGGGILGTHGLLGWECKGYVEWNGYCQRIIRQRIDDGILPASPIFTDVREFIESGCARQYRGFIDVVTGGFPCQPFSIAGKQAGADDERDMWPTTLRVIREVRPRFAFLENVRGLLTNDGGVYFRRILGQLSDSGYDARWCVLSARDCGAPHNRKRLWIVAHANTGQRNGTDKEIRSRGYTPDSRGADMAYTRCELRGERDIAGMETDKAIGMPRDLYNQSGGAGWWDIDPAEGPTQSSVGGVADGLASKLDIPRPVIARTALGVKNRVDRLRAIGNGQVPIVAATAWNILTGDLT